VSNHEEQMDEDALMASACDLQKKKTKKVRRG